MAALGVSIALAAAFPLRNQSEYLCANECDLDLTEDFWSGNQYLVTTPQCPDAAVCCSHSVTEVLTLCVTKANRFPARLWLPVCVDFDENGIALRKSCKITQAGSIFLSAKSGSAIAHGEDPNAGDLCFALRVVLHTPNAHSQSQRMRHACHHRMTG